MFCLVSIELNAFLIRDNLWFVRCCRYARVRKILGKLVGISDMIAFFVLISCGNFFLVGLCLFGVLFMCVCCFDLSGTLVVLLNTTAKQTRHELLKYILLEMDSNIYYQRLQHSKNRTIYIILNVLFVSFRSYTKTSRITVKLSIQLWSFVRGHRIVRWVMWLLWSDAGIFCFYGLWNGSATSRRTFDAG